MKTDKLEVEIAVTNVSDGLIVRLDDLGLATCCIIASCAPQPLVRGFWTVLGLALIYKRHKARKAKAKAQGTSLPDPGPTGPNPDAVGGLLFQAERARDWMHNTEQKVPQDIYEPLCWAIDEVKP